MRRHKREDVRGHEEDFFSSFNIAHGDDGVGGILGMGWDGRRSRCVGLGHFFGLFGGGGRGVAGSVLREMPLKRRFHVSLLTFAIHVVL